jgi:cystathionine gamma-synthase
MVEAEPLPPRPLSTATLCAQALGDDEAMPLGDPPAVVAPIHVTTTYIRDPDNQYRSGYAYGRPDNQTIRQAEALIARLEGAEQALLLGSGMSAAIAVFFALAPGDHIVAPKVMYWGLRDWLSGEARRWGLAVDLIDTSDPDELRAALQPGRTRLVWLETPANPLWTITDIAAAADLAHAAGARLAVDSTVSTPILSRPLALGADIVMHAATKYLNGHSDVIAGALACAKADDFWARIVQIRAQQGMILGPFEAYLLSRGMRTLDLRVRAASANALALAERLARHPQIIEVLYPGLASHRGHAIAARQMQAGFGGMLSIRLRGGEAAAIATAAQTIIWKRATSLGGVESLIEHRASVEGVGSPCPPDLLRLSTGLESVDDLFDDLDTAMRAAAA